MEGGSWNHAQSSGVARAVAEERGRDVGPVAAVDVGVRVVRAELVVDPPNPIREVPVIAIQPGVGDGKHLSAAIQCTSRVRQGVVDAADCPSVGIVNGQLGSQSDMQDPPVHGQDRYPLRINRARLAQVGVAHLPESCPSRDQQ